jgi:hypothetical protein
LIEAERRAQQAEAQLIKAENTSQQTNTQTQRDSPLEMASRNMIAPSARDAPKFSSKKPEELRRFLRTMEDLWQAADVTDDEVKKQTIGKYADQDTEEEWKALETYESGNTWETFKNELLSNYPEAAAAERGTPARIRRLCKETQGIRLGELATLYAFRRSFMAEAKKLTRAPAAMANRELVELFLGSLSEQMAAAVLQYLGNKVENGRQSTSPISTNLNPPRRPEDKYDLDEVCKAAVQMSESSQGIFYLMNKSVDEPVNERKTVLYNQPASEVGNLNQKLEELENIQAQERDKLDISNKNLNQRFSDLEGMMKTLLAQVGGGANGRKDTVKQYDPNSGVKLGTPGTIPRWGNNGRSNQPSKCYYCGGDHFVPECDEAKEDVRAGLVKWNTEGKLRLSDGSYIPSFPNTTLIKERVERYYAKKQSQYYLGNEEEEDVPSASIAKVAPSYTNIAEDPMRRRARLEQELDLKEREEALILKQLKLERDERKKDQHKVTRAAQVLEMLEQLTEDELPATKATKSGF